MADTCSRRDNRIFLGDLNAVSGCDRFGYDKSVFPHDAGADNCILLLEVQQTEDFWLLYQRFNLHPWAWYSSTGNVAQDSYCILVITRWKTLQNLRVYRRTEVCVADHRLVVATLRVYFKTPGGPVFNPRRFT